MDLDLPDLAVDFARSAREAIDAAGGVDLARAAEADPVARARVAELLERLGVGDLDPREDAERAIVAGELCRVAGSRMLPHPLVGTLLKRNGRRLALTGAGPRVRVNHGDLPVWTVCDLAGGAHSAFGSVVARQPLAPFVADMTRGAVDRPVPVLDRALWITLDAFVMLGAAQRGLDLAIEHIQQREQFGRPLASFQALRFRVADLVVGLRGAEALARYTTWRLFSSPADVLVDALSLRAAVLERSRLALRESHLLMGALGFCDEHDLSILDRHVQPHQRLPWDLEETMRLLAGQVSTQGIETLYGRFGGPSPSREVVSG